MDNGPSSLTSVFAMRKIFLVTLLAIGCVHSGADCPRLTESRIERDWLVRRVTVEEAEPAPPSPIAVGAEVGYVVIRDCGEIGSIVTLVS